MAGEHSSSQGDGHDGRPAPVDEEQGWELYARATSGDDPDGAAARAWAGWRRLSPDHEAIARRIESVWSDADALAVEVAGRPAAMRTPGRPRPQRRRSALKALAASVLMAAVIGYGALATRGHWQGAILNLTHDVATGVGERRELLLADGSRMVLDAASAVDLAMAGDRRDVILARGRLLVEVARDPDRPFTVTAGTVRALVLGTGFTVERRPSGTVSVAVLHGRVQVAVPHEPRQDPGRYQLGPGDRLTFGHGEVALDRIDPDRIAAWTRGVLLIDGRRLEDAVAMIDAHRGGASFIPDPDLAAMRVSASLNLDGGGDAALDRLAAALGLAVHRLPGGPVVITRR
ncbi:FecR domain-containing protein (plasmid) [Tistrella mobilis]|jgi:transmembrane sensor|uniref:FecR family protein n=1 Tax=Tistrella mobilis TaxID=171437 RepID=UPI0035570FF1